jgi:hypothetical protein
MRDALSSLKSSDDDNRSTAVRRRQRCRMVAVVLGLSLLSCVPSILASEHPAVRRVRAWSIGATLLADHGVVRQMNHVDCGHACLMNALLRLGRPVPSTLVYLARRARIGLSVAELVALGRAVGLETRAHRVPSTCIRSALEAVSFPVIALVGPHYLLLEERPLGDFITVIDPAIGRLRAPLGLLERQWRQVLVTFDADSTPESVCQQGKHSSQGGTT